VELEDRLTGDEREELGRLRAENTDKTKIYERLGLRLTYQLSADTLDVALEAPKRPGMIARPEYYVPYAGVRGAIDTTTPRNSWPIATDLQLARHSGSAEPLL